MRLVKKIRKILGPGIITGAADDDPSGIATYSQTGAQFGYGQLWTAIFMLPLQTAIQEACARIGAVQGKGIVAVIKEHHSKTVLNFVVLLVLLANVINIGADIGAMAEAAHLVIPINFVILTLFFTFITLILEILITYKRYASYLKWLCLSLLAYPLTLFIIDAPWTTILKATFLPHIEFSFAFLFIITGVLGTTISPYLFIWQASEEIEEEKARHLTRHHDKPHINNRFIRELRIDNFIGMLFSELVAWAIIIVAASVLHENGVTTINNAADAARALEPLVQTFPHSGYLAKMIFAIGVVGLGLLSVPVLAGSAAYALSEALDWRTGLNLKLKKAHGFYGIITLSTLLGLAINFVGIDPMRLLVYAAVMNGVVAVPLIYLIAKIAKSEAIMGQYKSGWLSKILVGLTLISMAMAALAMLYTFVVGR